METSANHILCHRLADAGTVFRVVAGFEQSIKPLGTISYSGAGKNQAASRARVDTEKMTKLGMELIETAEISACPTV
jgi:hypothetical protein